MFRRPIAGSGLNVVILGLNTALKSEKGRAADGEEAMQTLVLGQAQIRRLVLRASITPNGLVIALMHHPLDWLKDGSLARPILERHVHVQMTGHAHDAYTNVDATGALFLRSAAGSLWAGSTYDGNAYTLAKLVLEPGEESPTWVSLEVVGRVWRPRSDGWDADERLRQKALPKGQLKAVNAWRTGLSGSGTGAGLPPYPVVPADVTPLADNISTLDADLKELVRKGNKELALRIQLLVERLSLIPPEAARGALAWVADLVRALNEGNPPAPIVYAMVDAIRGLGDTTLKRDAEAVRQMVEPG